MDTTKKLKRSYDFQITHWTEQHIAKIRPCLGKGYGICLVGKGCTGKSTLIEMLAEEFQKSTLSLLVDSSVDSKTLLGAYVCGEVPGEFRWVPGFLTQAATRGDWLVLENFHTMSADIYSLFSHVLETQKLHIASKGEELQVDPEFRVFAVAEELPNLHFMTHWIILEIGTLEEFPGDFLNPVLKDCLLKVIRGINTTQGRELGLRDWVKLANRAEIHVKKLYGDKGIANNFLNSQFKAQLFLECIDISARNPDSILDVLSQALEVPHGELEAVLKHRIPQLTRNSIGRSPSFDKEIAQPYFAKTSYTLRLLETLSVGVYHKEPLLLVGDTGTGKTTMVQYLASLMGVKLYVHNLSQLSDPSDIVGGFKPIAVSSLIQPLISQFIDLFPHSETTAQLKLEYTNKNYKQVLQLIQSFTSDLERDEKIDSLREEAIKTEYKLQHSQFAFHFAEGSLVKAMKEGNWILLEEINLAENDVLERLHSILEGKGITLVERGDLSEIKPKGSFRLFGCMNPGKQVGKKELPLSLLRKFTQINVADMDLYEDIHILVKWYLEGRLRNQTIEKVCEFYLKVREMCSSGLIEDGRGRVPEYSLRTLCRTLRYVQEFGSVYTYELALFNALQVYFLTPLASPAALSPLIAQFYVPNREIPLPSPNFTHIFGYAMELGQFPIREDPSFILTPSIEHHLIQLSRTIIYANNAVLLEGPTSSGKTSMVKYLAGLTGHKLIRINNHHHTDIEEYIGSYTTDEMGKLYFLEGPLVQAVKEGHFLLLDELNLAPSEVLEALNRLLDDNRELFINETQTLVKPHPHFRLFATQNPTSGYGGRKELSSAFRNRFVEFFVPVLPDNELVRILNIKGKLAPSYAEVLVKIMKNLQSVRQETRTFMGREGIISIRDLLKIAYREPVGYSQLAHYAFMVMGERLRNPHEKETVMRVISEHCRNEKIDMNSWYEDYFKQYEGQLRNITLHREIRWNSHMKRLLALVDQATRLKEGVLLVGETGTAKTTICQILSQLKDLELRSINCHQNTETSDFIGSLRPVRNRESMRSTIKAYLDSLPEFSDHSVPLEYLAKELSQILPSELLPVLEKAVKVFEWADGPLIEAHQLGQVLLIDEISLADDSVLERLNSVLEESRTLLVPEKGTSEEMNAHEQFFIVATMNPGGDYGKKELSPALRNRFTEVWVSLSLLEMSEVISYEVGEYSEHVVKFVEWFNSQGNLYLSLRDALTWTDFMNNCQMSFPLNFWEGLSSILLDYLPNSNSCKDFVANSLGIPEPSYSSDLSIVGGSLVIGPYSLEVKQTELEGYSFEGPTVKSNLLKLVRAFSIPKPILLEGPPGVGKTSIVEALAKLVGVSVTRINLSEETELMDLLGCDLPVGKQFMWSDGVLLKAIKNGDWVILDELNLCPQPIIEGLNALLDHRASVYIPEINLEVPCAEGFRIFGAQNPLSQGGGRKGLPKSFLNRFTKIFISEMTSEDYTILLGDLYKNIQKPEILVSFNEKMKIVPWDFNLRDIIRCCESEDFQLVYYDRLRTQDQKLHFSETYEKFFSKQIESKPPYYRITPDFIEIGSVRLPNTGQSTGLELLPSTLKKLEEILKAVNYNWPVLLCGDAGTGKTSLVKIISKLYKVELQEYTLSANTDSTELLGSYELTENGDFVWFESTLSKAITLGKWVILKHANQCSSAVLDRINSLLEPNGQLLVNERGPVNGELFMLKPHQNFRIFLSFNPNLGEISRALRNRCIEIYIENEFTSFDLNRLQLNCKFEGLSLGEQVKWNKVLNEESMMQIESKAVYEPFDKFIENSLESYYREDISFLEENIESKLCIIGNSCKRDLEVRCTSLGCPELIGELNKNFFDEYSSCLDIYKQTISSENLLKIYYWIGVFLLSKNPADFQTIDEYRKEYYSCIARSNMSLHKFKGQLLNIPKDILNSWKIRLKIPSIALTQDTEKVVFNTSSSKAIKPSKYRYFIDEETEIGLVLDADSTAYEQSQALSFYTELFESVLFRSLNENPESFIDTIKDLEFIPIRIKSSIWILKQKYDYNTKIRLIAWEILNVCRIPELDFLDMYNNARGSSIMDAPMNWFLLNNILKWPRPRNSLNISEEYLNLITQELEVCERDEKIDGLLENNRVIGIGLWLYKHYIRLNEDPCCLYLDYKNDLNSLDSHFQEKIQVRENYNNFRYGWNPPNILEESYRSDLSFIHKQKEKLSGKIKERLQPVSEYFKFKNSMFSYDQFSGMVLHSMKNNSKYILDQISSLKTRIEKFNESFPDLCLPLLESLNLIIYGLANITSENEVTKQNPYYLSLIRGHILDDRSCTALIYKKLMKVTAPSSEPLNSFMIKLRKITEKQSVHTIGDKTRKENEEKYQKDLEKEVEALFPSYQHETLWNKEIKAKKDKLVQIWKDWEFSNGLHSSCIRKNLIKYIEKPCKGLMLNESMQIHMRLLMEKIEKTSEDYYRQSCPSECLKVYIPLAKLLFRTHELLEEWPENGNLQDIQETTYKTLCFPLLSTSLRHLASGMEKVAEKIQNWEEFSSSKVSLRAELSEIYQILRTWRMKELSSWEKLIQQCYKSAIHKDIKIWARLFRVLFSEDPFEIAAIEEYLQKSTMGTYEHRLNSLRIFSKHFPNNVSLIHVRKMYEEFAGYFKDTLHVLEEPIKTKITNAIQITKFDISNYHSWSYSVHKSHRQLSKFIKSYKEVLDTSFSVVLSKPLEEYSRSLIEHPLNIPESEIHSDVYENLCSDIFEQLELLKNSDHQARRSALSTLFDRLRSLGLKPTKDFNLNFFYLPVIEESDCKITKAAESYFYKNIYKIQLLQESIAGSQDLSLEDKETCLRFAFALFHESIKTRHSMIQQMNEYSQLLTLPSETSGQIQSILEHACSVYLDRLKSELLGEAIKPVYLFRPSNLITDIPEINKTIKSIGEMYPYLDEVLVPPSNFEERAVQYKTQSKLLYVILSIFINLFSNGFCKPEEEPEMSKNQEDGTGLAEGKGETNITNELIDEEQFNEQRDQESDSQEGLDKGDAMDVHNEMEGEDQSEKEQSAEDDVMEEAKGNERPLSPENDTRQADDPAPENSNQAPMSPEQSPEDLEMKSVDENQPASDLDSLDMNHNSEQSVSSGDEMSIDKEEEKLEEFKDREVTDYDNQAYGVEHLPANTENMQSGENTSNDIISQMKGEWNSQSQAHKNEVGANPEEDLQQTIEECEVTNEGNPADSSEVYKFDLSATDVTKAPSFQNTENYEKPVSVQRNEEETKEGFVHENKEFQKNEKQRKNEESSQISSIFPLMDGNLSYSQKVIEGAESFQDIESSYTRLESALPITEDWTKYSYTLASQAQALCEQLRIILEPRKARSLQGDYKTGKRINMRKVIAYFASNFRKDKIWLRRTRRTARDYQILVAVDDSFSMKQHSLGEMAKKGLFVVSSALTKLEVGEIGVAAIRDGMVLLHDLCVPFTEDSGKTVLSQFTFDYGQKTANDMVYPNFIKQATEYLQNFGSMQLVLIISDGRLNKAKVKPWLRKAKDIFFVFVILDNPGSSILNMKSTRFHEKNGKREVTVYPYLEDFPFEYYVVVQNPALLTETLSELIKQWFQIFKD